MSWEGADTMLSWVRHQSRKVQWCGNRGESDRETIASLEEQKTLSPMTRCVFRAVLDEHTLWSRNRFRTLSITQLNNQLSVWVFDRSYDWSISQQNSPDTLELTVWRGFVSYTRCRTAFWVLGSESSIHTQKSACYLVWVCVRAVNE